ncbi:MAG: CRISPR-associated helicase Cas3' [Isosphaeraceae bacterium]
MTRAKRTTGLRTVGGSDLLAKPPKGNRPGRSLVDHTLDVITAFVALFGRADEPSNLSVSWARFFRVIDVRAFLLNGLAAAFCHDWGKANDGFQAMLLGNLRQLLRHEQLSAVLMAWPSLWKWLASNRELDLPLLVSAVVGHHLKARDLEFGQPQAEIDTLVRMLWDHEEWQSRLPEMASRLKLRPEVPHNDVPRVWGFQGGASVADLARSVDDVTDRLERFGDELESDEQRRRLLWAVRAALIASDAAGSALFREGKSVASWIADAFSTEKRLDGSAVQRKVIEPRLDDLRKRNLWGDWNDFQRACADPVRVPPRALLLAPCGSGKTLAAWRWIAARCAEGPRGRVIFLYPTRGTATEGYRDYVSYAGPEEAALVHGTADYDLDGIHSDLRDEDRINEARLFALRQWPKRLFSATVDQFLGFLQHGYGPTCHLPLLVDSVVVFDEVHSYDRGMFSALLQFLQTFDVPVLCMTATLLEKRREKLSAHLAVFDGLKDCGDDLKVVADHPRYRIEVVADAKEAEGRVREAIDGRTRVLWVVNTVDRAQQIARQFATDPEACSMSTEKGVAIFCYHSRFKLCDRKKWHDSVVCAFRPGEGDEKKSLLAVTTQVCEMSLDLDADLLVTEFAPATSLAQRMGRCCRDPMAHQAERKRVGEVILYAPEDSLPYTKQDMLGVVEFVAGLRRAGTASQSKLEDLLADVPQAAELPKECRFIHSGPWAAMGEENFRDIDDYTRPSVLNPDEYLALCDSKRPWEAQGLIVPVPKKFAKPDDKLPSWLHYASGGRYHAALGYCDDPPSATIA